MLIKFAQINEFDYLRFLNNLFDEEIAILTLRCDVFSGKGFKIIENTMKRNKKSLKKVILYTKKCYDMVSLTEVVKSLNSELPFRFKVKTKD